MTMISTFKTAAVSLCCGFIGAYSALAIAAPDTVGEVKTNKLVITNADGKAVATLSATSAGLPEFHLKSPDEKCDIGLAIAEESAETGLTCKLQLSSGADSSVYMSADKTAAALAALRGPNHLGLISADNRGTICALQNGEGKTISIAAGNEYSAILAKGPTCKLVIIDPQDKSAMLEPTGISYSTPRKRYFGKRLSCADSS